MEHPKQHVRRQFSFVSEGDRDLLGALSLLLRSFYRTSFWIKMDERGFHASFHNTGDGWTEMDDNEDRLVAAASHWLASLTPKQRDAMSGQRGDEHDAYGFLITTKLTHDDREIITIVPHVITPIAMSREVVEVPG